MHTDRAPKRGEYPLSNNAPVRKVIEAVEHGAARWLEYAHRLDAREPGEIDLVVLHCTELPDLGTAREYGERIHYPSSRTGNAGHYYIDRDGRTEQWVPLDRVAHHVRGHNRNSVGIEPRQ